MARGRGRPRISGVDIAASSSPRRSTRGNSTRKRETTPDVYQELLQETISSTSAPDENNRPLKRRKIAGRRRESDAHFTQPAERPKAIPENAPEAVSDLENDEPRLRQSIELTEESDDSDLEWEDALGDGDDDGDDDADKADGQDVDTDATGEAGGVSITIGEEEAKEQGPRKPKRQGITAAERQRRLDIHKLHFLCLLYHGHIRNAWCNDEKVQATLRKLPPARILSNLVPNPDHMQSQASKIFTIAMQELSAFWAKRFSLTALGIKKVKWGEESAARNAQDLQYMDYIMDKDDFRRAATSLSGSIDVGAQLFCALLRAIGIEARLVCSLQCLTFGTEPLSYYEKRVKELGTKTVHLDPFKNSAQTDSAAESATVPETTPSPAKPTSSSSRQKPRSRLERIIGERHPSKLGGGVAPKKPSTGYKRSYPIYWVEAFNQATQKWIPIDPLCTGTVDKPEKLEPPQEYPNLLDYAIAFEEDHTARDVTLRYTKAFNAKTRKRRVEFTDGGTKWLKNALKPFKRVVRLDRDQIEDAQLSRRAAAEGIPKSVQDLKDHPIYVLERHLRHNEVLHPKHAVGKINLSTSKHLNMESIYRRKDVHIVRSADKWYRLGRDVKPGEQPLKHAKPKRNARARTQDPEDMDVDGRLEETGTALYALFQTEQYVPPPVVNGRVPRNTFGNLDLYVPSMVPPGGVHIRHKLAAKASRILGIDSADAVTGFSFKGRHGTAIIEGAVVAEEYKDAVEAVIEGMEYEQEEAENNMRSREALRMWRRFCLGLRLAQRINAIEIDGETGPQIDIDFQEEIDREDRRMAEEQLAGGFFVNDEAPVEPPSRDTRAPVEYAGGFLPDDGGTAGGFVPEASEAGGFIPEDEDASGFVPDETQDGGGFIPEDSSAGGGFIPEPSSPTNVSKIDGQPPPPAEANGASTHNNNEKSKEGLHRNLSPGPDENRDDSWEAKEAQTLQKADTTLTQDLSAVAMESETNKGQSVHSTVVIREPPREITESVPVLESVPERPSSSPSDAGSLPLEDPEDEDADPDWLVDVT